MSVEQTSRTDSATRRVTVHAKVHDVEPLHKPGMKGIFFQPELITVYVEQTSGRKVEIQRVLIKGPALKNNVPAQNATTAFYVRAEDKPDIPGWDSLPAWAIQHLNELLVELEAEEWRVGKPQPFWLRDLLDDLDAAGILALKTLDREQARTLWETAATYFPPQG